MLRVIRHRGGIRSLLDLARITKQNTATALLWAGLGFPCHRVRDAFEHSVKLGRQLAELLDPEANIATVTGGEVAESLEDHGRSVRYRSRGYCWLGSGDSKGRVNPGQGRSEARTYTSIEREAIQKGAKALGMDAERALDLLGPPIDVYLNAKTCWQCVPTSVWDYFIGGYQVIKKWLSYREATIFGRALTKEEAREVTGMVRRLATIVLMTDNLNSNYGAVRDAAVKWPPQVN